MAQSVVLSIHSSFGPFDLHVETPFRATTCIVSLWNQRLFSKSSGHMFAFHATSHGCPVVLACLRTASSRASFLGVQPSECQNNNEKTRNPPVAFTHAWAILPSLPGSTQSSLLLLPQLLPKLLSTATKTPPDVCFRSSLLALSSVILAASAADLHPSLASLLNCSSISSFPSLRFIPKKISHFPFVPSHVLPLCAPR